MSLALPQHMRPLLAPFFMALGYCIFFLWFNQFLVQTGLAAGRITAAQLCVWDASYYREIAEHGYVFTTEGCNSGFYLLFPLLWKALHLGVWGAILMNILLFATGFAITCSLVGASDTDRLLYLTIPTTFFMVMPYSEALFFLLCSILLLGLRKQVKPLVFIALVLLALTRATAVLLLPALLIMQLFGAQDASIRKRLVEFVWLMALPTLLGTAIFVLYQYMDTGVWFAYYIQQSTNWARSFNMPTLPFADLHNSNQTLWLSATAMFAAASAGFCMVRWAINGVKNKPIDPLLLLSASYLFFTLLTTVFYNPTWGQGLTLVIGARRYIMANPFFYIFLAHITTQSRFKPAEIVGIATLSVAFWMLFGAYNHIAFLAYFLFGTLLITLLILGSNKKWSWPSVALAIICFFFQVLLFQATITGSFPD